MFGSIKYPPPPSSLASTSSRGQLSETKHHHHHREFSTNSSGNLRSHSQPPPTILSRSCESVSPFNTFAMHDLIEDLDNPDKALFKGVRASKFRHVYGSVARKDQCYDNINITKNAHDSNFCAVNLKFLAIVTESCGGGSFIVVPIDKVGRIDQHAGRVTGHKGQIYDIKWNPFNDNVIASCSDDTTVKLWYIPDGGLLSRNMNQPFVELRGHKRRVSFVEWHPTADNILVSAGFDYLIIMWNTAKAEAVRVITCHLDAIHSLSWNRDGSLFATTCKDKKLRIIDPRLGKVVNEGLCHHGTKASKVVFLGDSQRLFTVGFSRYSDRQWAIWSQHDLSQPITIENIDSSSGVLFPFYDHDTRMVYVAGKGDGNIRYYETTDEPPYCHYLSQFLSGQPQRGLGVMPKRGCDVYKCEVIRFYKLHATKSMCEPISMIVPRKSEQFQNDIFPDTAAPTPALTAEQWLHGQNRNPILFNLKTGAGAKTNKPMLFMKPNGDGGGGGGAPLPALSAFNNERKFEFISQTNQIDYREKPQPQPESLQRQISDSSESSERKRRANDKLNGHRKHFEEAKNHFESKDGSWMLSKQKQGAKKSNGSNSRSKLPWVKDDDDGDDEEEDDQSMPMCDIVKTKNMPQNAAYVTIHDDSDDSANTTDDSISDELINFPNGHSNNNSNGSFNSNFNSNSTNNSPTNSASDSLGEKNLSMSDIEARIEISPKNERQLWEAFHEQRSIIIYLKQQLKEKNKQIDELKKMANFH